MISCLAIETTANLNKPCDPPVVGVRPVFYMGFLHQLAGVGRKAGDKKIITDLTLKPGKKLTKIEGYKTSNNFSLSSNATDYGMYLPHTGIFTVFDQTSAGLSQVDILAGIDNAFIITKMNGLLGNWRVLGINTGLATTAVGAGFNEPTGGAANVTMVAQYERTTMEIFQHITGVLDDTDSYLAGLAYADV